MTSPQIPPELEPVVAFHGHLCPGLLIGWRASRMAMKLLNLSRDVDEEIVAVTENDACGVDAIQAVLGCTFGKGNLIFHDYGKQAFTVFRRDDGRGVRLVYRSPATRLSRDEAICRLLAEPDEALFDVKAPQEPIPQKAQIRDSARCSVCGEKVMATRLETCPDGRKVCIPCAEKLRRTTK
ncbi:MAG: FmdE family protein [Pyramidobacter sp.]|jgi:formylmethanofuran dehydrogenase subunit E